MGFLKEHSFFIAQIIGFCAMAMAIISYQQRKRKHILTFQLICAALWALHFLTLGNMTACVVNGLSAVRCVVYFCKEKQKWAQHIVWPCLFFVASIAAGVLTWESAWSLLPMCGMMISTVGLWQNNPKVLRLQSLPVSVVWLVYDTVFQSYAGVCNEIFLIISVCLALYRLDYKKK